MGDDVNKNVFIVFLKIGVLQYMKVCTIEIIVFTIDTWSNYQIYLWVLTEAYTVVEWEGGGKLQDNFKQ